MTTSVTDHDYLERLRSDAEQRLHQGSAPSTSGWTISTDALARLFKLASDNRRVGDALKLLHELQTHQVELDLQHAQLEANAADHDSALAHYQALFEHAPAGYFVLEPDRRIASANAAAVALTDMAADRLAGLAFSNLLTPESRPALARLLDGAGPLSVQFRNRGQWSQLSAASSLDDDAIFLIATDASLKPGD